MTPEYEKGIAKEFADALIFTSKEVDDLIAEAIAAERQRLLEALPEEMLGMVGRFEDNYVDGFNNALCDIRAIINKQ